MSEQPHEDSTTDVADAQREAAGHVVDRVGSWDEGAEPETVRQDLEEGMTEAGVRVGQAELDRMSEEIHDEGTTEAPEVE